MEHIIAAFLIVGISSPYARHAAAVKMKVASPDSVFLFNYRGSTEYLEKLVFISGRRDDDGKPRDGARALYDILRDAKSNHQKTCLKIPKEAIIKLKGMLK